MIKNKGTKKLYYLSTALLNFKIYLSIIPLQQDYPFPK